MAKPRWIFLVIGPHGVCGWTHATLTSTGLEWQELFKKKMQWLEPWSPYLKRGKVVWRRMQLYGSVMLITEVSLMLGGWPAPAPSYPPPLLLVPLLSGSSQDTKAHSDFFSAFFFFFPLSTPATFVPSSLSSRQLFWLFELWVLFGEVISRTVLDCVLAPFSSESC